MANLFTDTLALLRSASALSTDGGLVDSYGVRSPWSQGQLSKVAWSDILGSELLPVTRAEAMSVPAIARGRHLLCSTISRLPLRVMAGDQVVEPQPSWTYKAVGVVPAHHRMLWTVDDLIFAGWSLWAKTPANDGGERHLYRVPLEMWEFDPDTSGVLVNGELKDDDDVVLIPGPHEGILNYASRTVRGGRRLEELWVARVQNPMAATELHQTDQVQLDDDEIDELVDDWNSALAQTGGAVAYTPHNIEVRTHGDSAGAAMLVEGRNAAAVDQARVLGVPASLIDASNVNASLTYETVSGRNLEFVEYSLALYLDPIASRLSLDDVVAPGERTVFDLETLTGRFSSTGAKLED